MGLLVDQQCFDLMEHGRMGRVVIAAVGAARHDHPIRRRAGLHGADLHRRGMGAQDQAARVGAVGPGQIEGVVVLTGRMVGRNVEGGEVVPVILDVRALGDAEAHIAQDGDDFLDDLADRVDAPRVLRSGRQGDVEALLAQAGVERRPLHGRLAGVQGVCDGILQGVEGLARFAPPVGVKRPQALHLIGDAALLTEGRHAHLFERVQIARRLNGGKQFLTELVDTLHGQASSFRWRCRCRRAAPCRDGRRIPGRD